MKGVQNYFNSHILDAYEKAEIDLEVVGEKFNDLYAENIADRLHKLLDRARPCYTTKEVNEIGRLYEESKKIMKNYKSNQNVKALEK